MSAQYQLVIRTGPNTGKVFPLEAPELIIGRDAGNDVSINDAEVSRKHAKLSLHGTAYVIQDLGSTNGTFVNGQRITSSHVLNSGDTVSFGETITLIYEATYDSNATVISSALDQRTVAPVQRSAPTPAPMVPPVPAPASAPAPAPVQAPMPVYSGQVPAGPLPVAAPKKKKKFPIWLVFVIIILLVVCACVGLFLIIDQLNLWCKVVPFLVPLLGGTCS